jgi:hypothetical protein
MSNNEILMNDSLYSYNKNSNESYENNSLMKIVDNQNEEWSFNKKLKKKNNENNIINQIDKKESIESSNKTILNDEFRDNSKSSEDRISDNINLKKKLFSFIENEKINNEENYNKSNNSIMKQLLFIDTSYNSRNDNDIKENKNEFQKDKAKKNNITQENIKKNNLYLNQSTQKSNNSNNIPTHSSNKENMFNILNINNMDKLSNNSFNIYQNKTKSNKSSKSQKLGNENDIKFEPSRLSVKHLRKINLIKIYNNNKEKNDNNNQFEKENSFKTYKTENNNNSMLNKMKLNNINNLSSDLSNKGIMKFTTKKNQMYINIRNNNLQEWLKDIDLLCYYNLFINKGIYSFEKVIKDMKEEKVKISKNDIKDIGIEKIGHIFRIITKLELDSDLIDNKIYKEILKYSKIDNYLLNSNDFYYGYDCCCSYQDKININPMKFKLDNWLKKNNLIHLKENFICNGYDKMEYFILQMFSTFPINDSILKNELKINCEKDRNIILLKLNKDIKRILININNSKNSKEKVNDRENKIPKFEFFGEDDEEICKIY